MSAFLYQPTVGRKIIWFAATSPGTYIAVCNPMIFNVVTINEGYGFRQLPPFQNMFVCPEAGLYYVSVTAHNLNEGIQMTFMVNQQPIASLNREFGEDIYSTMRSRSALVRLNQNDHLYVAKTDQSILLSAHFSGFKLYS